MTATTCPSCGTPTRPYRGCRTLCFDCSLADVGEKAWEASRKVTRGYAEQAAKIMAGGRADQALRS